MKVDLHSSVVDWCIEHPEALAVLERLGIDYCCGGKSLEYACHQRSLNPKQVLAELEQAIGSRPRERRQDAPP